MSVPLRRSLAVMLTMMLLASSASVSAQPAPVKFQRDDTSSTTNAFQSYEVHLGNPDWMIAVTKPNQDVDAEVRQRERAELSAALDELVAAGKAGPYSYDDAENVFHVQLSDAGRTELSRNSLVDSIEPEIAPTAFNPLKNNLSTQAGINSIDYVQVFTPFMWGFVNTGGLSVDIKLFASDGTTQIGVPCQLARTSGPNYVVIDNAVLYFETVFVKPDSTDPTKPDPSVNANQCSPSVNIMPGDVVKVVTTGPGATSTNVINVDDIDGWESYRQDTVSGTVNVQKAGSTVFVTTGGLGIGTPYLLPGTYRGFTPSGTGTFNFTVSNWCKLTGGTQPDPSCAPTATVNLNPGAAGWIRVKHPDGNEVYANYGYTLKAFENGFKIRGYDFQLPGPVGDLKAPGVTVHRPPIVETITLNPSGTIMTVSGGNPYDITTPVLITPNSTIQMKINENPHVITVNVSPLTATINLGANQVTGTGPSNTPLDLVVNDTDGYVKKQFSTHYMQQFPTTDGGGHFASSPFTCAQNGQFRLQPGSFGTVGFEDPKGNFVYIGYAAPTADVMTHYPFVEGWVANSLDVATVKLQDSGGVTKDQQVVEPILIYMTRFQRYVHSYFNVTPTQNITPGDVVTVTAPGVNFRIPVDDIGGQLNADAEFISGHAPPGSTVKVIPLNNLSAYYQITADGSGGFVTGKPFATTDGGCKQGTWAPGFNQGDGGRIYVLHGDGTRVFTYYGRAINVNENERAIDLYLYLTHGIDWDTATNRQVTVTLMPAQGTPVSVTVNASGNGSDHVSLNSVNLATWPNVQAGDTVTASFSEGPNSGPQQTATINFASIPLLTGSGNLDNSTLAGAAPAAWWGIARLTQPVGSNPVAIPPRQFAAYGPVQFFSGRNTTPIPLAQGYGGQVSMTDAWNYVSTDGSNHSVWIAWKITVIPVVITGFLKPGDTVVCGKGPPNATINIYDVTNNSTLLNIILGTGSTDSAGHFCITVNAPLHLGQVVMAGTPPPDNNLSQPVVVLNPIFLPIVFH